MHGSHEISARLKLTKQSFRIMPKIPDQPPMTILELIDEAVNSTSAAAHSCRNEVAREHFEYALALLRESWIAESGQEARSAEQVMADVLAAMNLFKLVLNENPQKGGL